MPRKVSLPPAILKVESLSDGREIRPKSFVEDFPEGRELPVKPDPTPARVMQSGNELLDARKRAKLAAQLNMLKAVGIVEDDRPKPPPKPVIPEKPGMRAIGKLGDDRVIYVPLPPYRRW